MTIGITAGVFIGNFLGGIIKSINEGKILDGMTAEQVYRARHHPGFEIWIGVILLSIIVGKLLQLLYSKTRKPI